MTDKVQKIREEVERLKSQLLRGACSSQIAMETRCKEEAYNEVLAILDTMQEEPVSEELEDAANNALERILDKYGLVGTGSCLEMFKLGAQWQKEHLWKSADGKELPEIDRDIICLLDCGKVIKAHRPSKKDNLYVPEPYGKGGWNYPNIKYWLDAELPKEIEL
jgi:DNA-directed RNA polymerase specialized sigma subunit